MTADRRTGRRLGLAVLMLLPLSGCGASGADLSGTLSLRPFGPHLSIGVPSGWSVSTFGDPVRDTFQPGCQYQQAALSPADGPPYVEIDLVGKDCAGGRHQPAPGNGRHGHYVSVGDATSAADVTTASTETGTITLFTQPYYECTNSCRNYTDHVALLHFTHPPDSRFPTLMIVTDDSSVTAAELQALASSVRVT